MIHNTLSKEYLKRKSLNSEVMPRPAQVQLKKEIFKRKIEDVDQYFDRLEGTMTIV